MIKVLITGPESSGKTHLAKFMARRFRSPWVPEFARTYLADIERTYQEEDLLNILNGQLRLQQQYRDTPLLFCDTGPEVIYIWSKVKFGRVDAHIHQCLEKYQYDLTLLCAPDLPWQPDLLREHPTTAARQQLFEQYEDLLQQVDRDYTIVQGQEEDRLRIALHAMQSLMNTNDQDEVSK